MASPAPPSQTKGHSSDYYYFIIAIAAIAIFLVTSRVVTVGCCSRCCLVQAVLRLLRSRGVLAGGQEEEQISQLIPSCKYRSEQAASNSECSVCLTAFADGEEVRQLPECKHLFHAPCIDMWLYSHSNCPMCRADVLRFLLESSRCPRAAARGETTQLSLIESGGMARVVTSLL